MVRLTPSILKRLQRYEVNDRGCWEWAGYKNHHGYGRMLVRRDGKNRLLAVHRLAYQAWVGEIPADKIVMHTCDNRCCINPEHLRVGTQGDNMRDMVSRGRYRDWRTIGERVAIVDGALGVMPDG